MISIRHAHIRDVSDLARIIILATQSAFHGRVPDVCLQWLSPEESARNWAKNFVADDQLEDGDWLFVAEDETAGVVGLVMVSTITAEFGYECTITDLYSHDLLSLQVDPAWHGQGIGRLLVVKALETVRMADGLRLMVRVLADNPNVAFYEHIGADKFGERPYNWSGYETVEYLYGWPREHTLKSA